MISVTYYRKLHRVHVTGHAETGEAGYDLVCAAATILMRTLVANVLELSAEERRYVRYPEWRLAEGEAWVVCKPVHRYASMVELIYDSVIRGFALLSEQFPEAVTYKEIKGF